MDQGEAVGSSMEEIDQLMVRVEGMRRGAIRQSDALAVVGASAVASRSRWEGSGLLGADPPEAGHVSTNGVPALRATRLAQVPEQPKAGAKASAAHLAYGRGFRELTL